MTEPTGAFRAESLLGSGGLGRVYRAVHEPSGAAVALKTLHRTGTSEEAYRLLVREAAAAAQLRHPHVVELLDFVVDQGRPYLVLELVEGRDIECWIDRWPGVAITARALDEVLDGLSVAHAAGILHRDLKPANLLYTAAGSVKITDFGMAELIDPLAARDDVELGGTPLYMAPEQLDPFGHQGPWTDLYAVGVILYLLLSGHEPIDPFERDWKAAKLRPPPRLHPRSGLRVPGELATLIGRLLDPSPAGRPRFAAEVRGELRALFPRITEEGPVERGIAPSSRRRQSSLASAPTAVAPTPSSDLGSAPTAAVHFDESSPVAYRIDTSSTGEPLLATPVHGGVRSRSRGTSPPPPLPLLPFSIPAPRELVTATSLLRLRPPPLVARRDERRLVMEMVEDVLQRDRPRLLTLIGEAGVGKSRVARWALGEVEHLGLMEGSAAGYDVSGTNDGLRHALRRLLGPARDADASDPQPAAWKRLGLEPSTIELAKLHGWLEGTDTGTQLGTRERVELAHRALALASQVRPLYLWLDDIAWSRDGAFDLVERLLDQGDARVALVLTLRSGPADHPAVRARLDALKRRGGVEHRMLRFDRAARRELLGAVGALAPETCQALAEAVDETPLVLVQLAQELITSGALVPSPRGWALARGQTVAGLLAARPMSELLSARVGQLCSSFAERAADAESVLLRAALLGLRFDDAALTAAVGPSQKKRFVFLVTSRALLHGILRAEPGGGHRFEHGLVRDAVLDRLDQRSDRHQILTAVAQGVLATYGDARAQVRVRAAQLLERAGQHDESLDLLYGAIQDHLLMGSTDWSAELIQLAWTWERQHPNATRRIKILLLEAAKAYFELTYDLGLEWIRQARELAVAEGDVALTNRCLTLEASLLFYSGRLAEAERAAAAALEHCSLDDPRTTESGMGAAHRLGEIRALRGEYQQALDSFELSAEYARRERVSRRLTIVEFDMVDLELAMGRFDDADARIVRLRQTVSDPRGADWLQFMPDVELRALVRRGRGGSALDAIRARADHFARRNEKWRLTAWRLLAALASPQSGDREGTAAAVAEFQRAFAECPHEKPFTFWALDELARQLDRLALPEEAARVRATTTGLRAWIARGLSEATSPGPRPPPLGTPAR